MVTYREDIPRILCNPKGHYRFYRIPSLVLILSQINLVHNFPPYFSKNHSNVILQSSYMSSEMSLPFGISDENFVCIYHIPMLAPCPVHLILLDLISLMSFGEACKLWNFLLCSLAAFPFPLPRSFQRIRPKSDAPCRVDRDQLGITLSCV
jgi:hypothetical protein